MKTFKLWETGSVRKNNEDAYLILANEGLWAVADGMGGHNAGEVASALAVGTLEQRADQLFLLAVEHVVPWLEKVMQEANENILEASHKDGWEGMGTTLTALVLKEEKAIIGHIGDSRAYLWREDTLSLLSQDHSLVYELMRLGQLSEEQARNHPRKNVLSRALGAGQKADVDCSQLKVQDGDVFLLCTDGVTNVLSEEEIKAGLSEGEICQEMLNAWGRLVWERGAPDNFTLLCVVVER